MRKQIPPYMHSSTPKGAQSSSPKGAPNSNSKESLTSPPKGVNPSTPQGGKKNPGPTLTKESPPTYFAPVGGFSILKAETAAQKKKRKHNDATQAEAITTHSHTWYPSWNGSLKGLQNYVESFPNSSPFALVNTSSLAAKVGGLTINFYVSTRSFQVTRTRNVKQEILVNFVTTLKNWLDFNRDDNHNMIAEILTVIDPTRVTPT